LSSIDAPLARQPGAHACSPPKQRNYLALIIGAIAVAAALMFMWNRLLRPAGGGEDGGVAPRFRRKQRMAEAL